MISLPPSVGPSMKAKRHGGSIRTGTSCTFESLRTAGAEGANHEMHVVTVRMRLAWLLGLDGRMEGWRSLYSKL